MIVRMKFEKRDIVFCREAIGVLSRPASAGLKEKKSLCESVWVCGHLNNKREICVSLRQLRSLWIIKQKINWVSVVNCLLSVVKTMEMVLY
jgi:hypothetical protein